MSKSSHVGLAMLAAVLLPGVTGAYAFGPPAGTRQTLLAMATDRPEVLTVPSAAETARPSGQPTGDSTLRLESNEAESQPTPVAMDLAAKKPKPKPKPKCRWDAATGTYICTF